MPATCRRCAGLAGDLPLFDSLWIDALAQSRLLTGYQAAECNAGRGDRLTVGPFLLVRPLESLGFADCYHARQIESDERVRLYLVSKPAPDRETAARQLAALAERAARLDDEGLLPIQSCASTANACGRRACFRPLPLWVWMVGHGRLPPEMVLHVARSMVGARRARAAANRPRRLVGRVAVDRSGPGAAAHPGFPRAVRPAEGYAHNDLPPAAYDYLATERIAAGAPPTTAGDLYACGALWWHLLAGRPPFAGGNGLVKLHRAHAARASDVRALAPDVPPQLARAIDRLLSPQPEQRPPALLNWPRSGLPARGAGKLARMFDPRRRVRVQLGTDLTREPATGKLARRAALATVAAVLLVAVELARLAARAVRATRLLAARTHVATPPAAAPAAAPANPARKAHRRQEQTGAFVPRRKFREPQTGLAGCVLDRSGAGPDFAQRPPDPAGRLAPSVGQTVRGCRGAPPARCRARAWAGNHGRGRAV